MGPFIPKKDTVNEDGGSNRRRPARITYTQVFSSFDPPRTRQHRGEWNNNYTTIRCRDCDFVTVSVIQHDPLCASEWARHAREAPRVRA